MNLVVLMNLNLTVINHHHNTPKHPSLTSVPGQTYQTHKAAASTETMREKKEKQATISNLIVQNIP
jgi:hypothetical protein